MRHGQAQNFAPSDADRSLTQKGREETQGMALWLKRRKVKPDTIFTSPLRRARETGQILSSVFGPAQKVEETKYLLSEANPSDLFDFLLSLDKPQVLMVTHMPFVADFLSLMIGEKKGHFSFVPSTIASILCPEKCFGSGTLEWMVHPGLILE